MLPVTTRFSNLPTEKLLQKPLEEFLRLGKLLKQENKGFEITFSFSSFVPKPQTPFQWETREDSSTLEKKQKFLEKEFAKIGIGTKFSSIKWDYWQSLISRADENFSEFLVYVYKNGGKNGAYKAALKALKFSPQKEIFGFDYVDTLPWDIIENYPEKLNLYKEYERLKRRGG